MDFWWNPAMCKQPRATPSSFCRAPTAAARWAKSPASTPRKTTAPTTSSPPTSATTSASSRNPDHGENLWHQITYGLGGDLQPWEHGANQVLLEIQTASGEQELVPVRRMTLLRN